MTHFKPYTIGDAAHKVAHYFGAELRPFDGRPNAMDAYALPSVVDGVRIPRALPICAPTTNRA